MCGDYERDRRSIVGCGELCERVCRVPGGMRVKSEGVVGSGGDMRSKVGCGELCEGVCRVQGVCFVMWVKLEGVVGVVGERA